MSDLFTVKLDLSAVTHDENEKLYILLVDPTRMKMIYQFKLWVRFLFSIDCPIKLIYEGAAIHDLEDIHILVLLKTVRVECADYGVGEREQREELIAKLNRYDEWRDGLTPAITPQKHYEVMHGDNFPKASGGFHHLGVSKIEGNEYNPSSNASERRSENVIHYPVSSQNEVKNQTSCTNSNLNVSSNSCLYNGHETDNGNNCNEKFQSESHSLKDECLNEIHNSTPKVLNETTKSPKNKWGSSGRRSVNKPFSLYNFLHSLRSQESNADNKNKIKNVVEVENIDFNSSDIKLKDNGANIEDMGQDEHMFKKKRKRIRKHKQKNKTHSDFNIPAQALTPVFHGQQRTKSVSVSPRPKHIRFDADGEDCSDIVTINSSQKKSPTAKDNTSGCPYNTDIESSNDKKYNVIPSVEEDNFADETDNVIAATVHIINNPQESEINFKDESMTEDKGGVKNESLGGSPHSILDILESLKRKSNTPPVFDRFANCM